MATTTNNMSLLIPLAGETDYATSVSTSFTNIDNHDHTAGKGVQLATAAISDSAITTAKINNLAVTRAKLEAVGEETGNQSGTFDFSNQPSAQDVPGVTATITTTGRPVVILVYGGLNSAIGLTKLATNIQAQIYIDRGGTNISNGLYDLLNPSITNIKYPISLSYVDAVVAGTYTYKLKGSVSDGQMIIGGAIITVYEL